MNLIENITNPIVGEKYFVKCIKSSLKHSISSFNNNWIPVIGHYHCETFDGNKITDEHKMQRLKQNNPYFDMFHYHIDWRFLPIEYINKVENEYLNTGVHNSSVKNSHLRYAIFESFGKLEEKIMELTLMREFHEFDTLAFWGNYFGIEKWIKSQMHDFICPHKGTNLRSCKIKNNKIQCPAHGAVFNATTGEFLKENLE